MPHARARQNDHAARRTRRRRVIVRIAGVGFTLAEMLVAISVVAVLTLGIGRIFASVSKLVGTGAAVGEVDQIARVIETQLRADFIAASRLAPEENFLVIVNRRLGDANHNDSLDIGDEMDVYLTPDDEQADLKRNADPYAVNPSNKAPISKAVTVRLDQIFFLAAAPEGYRSFQPPPASEQLASVALISWGHALRPPIDARADAQGRPPYRLNYPDGDFAFARSDENPFAPSDNQFGGKSTGRNRYAGDFILARQAVLLAGGLAGGEAGINSTSRFTPLWGEDTEVALYPRDLEASYLFAQDPTGRAVFGGIDEADSERNSEGDGGPDGWANVDILPNPRLLRHGRTDILAVDRTGFQQWLEGVGVPFSTGRLSDPSITNPPIAIPPNPPFLPKALNVVSDNRPNCRLWLTRDGSSTWPGTIIDQYDENLRGVQSALAGLVHRVLVEPEPAFLRQDPNDPVLSYPSPAVASYSEPDPLDRRMDLQALMAAHCSNFEVAWSDGSTWLGNSTEIDADGDNHTDREFRKGDTVWFDMDYTFRDFWRTNGFGGDSNTPTNPNARVFPRPNPDPEIGLDDTRVFDWMPNRFPTSPRADNTIDNALEYRISNTLNTDEKFTLPAFCPKWNTLPFIVSGSNAVVRPEQEYLGVWGFRVPEGADQGPNPASVGEYGGAWVKPRLIRIRMTLHDSQHRLEGGKQFEFIFRLDAGGS